MYLFYCYSLKILKVKVEPQTTTCTKKVNLVFALVYYSKKYSSLTFIWEEFFQKFSITSEGIRFCSLTRKNCYQTCLEDYKAKLEKELRRKKRISSSFLRVTAFWINLIIVWQQERQSFAFHSHFVSWIKLFLYVTERTWLILPSNV
jgi:hypothetical protein